MEKYLKLAIILWSLPVFLSAQYATALIYGEITLKNGETYTGQMRWEGDQSLWHDVFRADKNDRPALNLLSEKELGQINDRSDSFQFGFMELWEDKRPETNFLFQCSFGDIESLKNIGENKVSLRLRNGKSIALKKGKGGDLDKDVFIYDNASGRLTLDFDRIKSIDFRPAPKNLKSPLGYPIHGKVLTSSGVLEGFITWDLEERLGKDLISGRQKGTKIDIEFADIHEIKAQGDGSLLSLKSGRTLFLNDHDDVDKGNHGIVISGPDSYQVKVSWQNFISLTLSKPSFKINSYEHFKSPKLLRGSIRTKDGKQFKGQIVFDLDEIYNIEFLNGENNGLEYIIPFWKVGKIEPQNDRFSMVYLTDGKQLLLGNHNDVTENNHGLIVRGKNGKDDYIDWRHIKTIDFD